MAGGQARERGLYSENTRLVQAETACLVEMVRSVKTDTVTLELQRKFFDDSAKPLETKPIR